jgi:putative membrane protein
MIRLILRLLINMAAFWVASYFIADIQVTGSFFSWVLLAIIFALVNTFIRPLVRLLSLPLTIVTLGLFTLVINALMLMLTGWLAGDILTVGGFIPAFLGSIVISIVSTVLSWFLPDKK